MMKLRLARPELLKPYGVRHADMPLTPAQVWRTIKGRPLRTDMAIGDQRRGQTGTGKSVPRCTLHLCRTSKRGEPGVEMVISDAKSCRVVISAEKLWPAGRNAGIGVCRGPV
jgi:hypothetical protein